MEKTTGSVVFQIGSKQYKADVGDLIQVELMHADVGDSVDIPQVLMVTADNKVWLGYPFVDGAHVKADVDSHGKHKKLIVFKYKNKTRYRRKQGHRQNYTALRIKEIVTPV